MQSRPQRVKGPLETAQDRIDDLASKIIYSIATTNRIYEILDESNDGVELTKLRSKSPELYQMVVYSAKNAIIERTYAF